MNKRVIAVLLVAAMLVLTGCGNGSGNSGGSHSKGGSAGVNDVLEKGKKTEDKKNATPTAVPTPTEVVQLPDVTVTDVPLPKGDGSIDIDLTQLSATMVYTEVNNMLMQPDNYLGRTVKMNGTFVVYVDNETGAYYYACIIQDATACCASGIEFVLDGDHKFPDDYPELETEITVVGVFDTYYEGTDRYCTLRKASLQ